MWCRGVLKQSLNHGGSLLSVMSTGPCRVMVTVTADGCLELQDGRMGFAEGLDGRFFVGKFGQDEDRKGG